MESALDYCAGVVDAAGSIRGQQMRRADRPNDTYRMKVSVIADTPEVLQLLSSAFGGRVTREAAGRSLPIYRWTLTNREALARFTKKMRGRLQALEPQLEILDEFLTTTRPIYGPRGAPPEEIRARRELFRKLTFANMCRRGIDEESASDGALSKQATASRTASK